jgi:two-component sensor histidine kinase
MQLANTTQVLNIVNNIVNNSAKYADKGTNNTRLLAWRISKQNANTYVKEVQDIFTLAGFNNRIKVTTSKYSSATFLRINASFNKE